MKLVENNNEIEFLITGYESPDLKSSEDFDYDANWLNDAVIYNGKTHTFAGILTTEIAEFIEEMEKVHSGKQPNCSLEPIEPGIIMTVEKKNDKFDFTLQFGINDMRTVTQNLTKKEFMEKINDFKEILQKYPVR